MKLKKKQQQRPKKAPKKKTTSKPSRQLNDGLKVRYKECWGKVESGFNSYKFLPGSSGLKHLDSLAAIYESYKILSTVRVSFASSTSATTSGEIVMGVDYDARDEISDFHGVCALQPKHVGPVRNAGNLSVPHTRAMHKKWLFTNSSAAPGEAAFAIHVYNGAAESAGTMWVEYDLHFISPTTKASLVSVFESFEVPASSGGGVANRPIYSSIRMLGNTAYNEKIAANTVLWVVSEYDVQINTIFWTILESLTRYIEGRPYKVKAVKAIKETQDVPATCSGSGNFWAIATSAYAAYTALIACWSVHFDLPKKDAPAPTPIVSPTTLKEPFSNPSPTREDINAQAKLQSYPKKKREMTRAEAEEAIRKSVRDADAARWNSIVEFFSRGNLQRTLQQDLDKAQNCPTTLIRDDPTPVLEKQELESPLEFTETSCQLTIDE